MTIVDARPAMASTIVDACPAMTWTMIDARRQRVNYNQVMLQLLC